MILIATMNQEFWNGKIWQDQAEAVQDQGLIKEKVTNYAKTMVKKAVVLNMIRNTKVPVLTDDYAPVDTLQNPLL